MEGENQTRISEFVLLGLLGSPEQQQQQQQRLIFWLFLWMYLLGGAGNLLMILAVSSDPLLHTPMYFFLSNLSFVDLCLITTTVPKMLLNIQTQKKTISYAGCLTQMYFFSLLLGMDNMILAVMAFDRNVAICHPLHYTSVMLPSLCGLLVAVPWVLTNLISLSLTLLTARLSFCGNNEIPHFFCDINGLLKLSCSDTRSAENLLLILTSVLGMPPLVGILASYSRIVATVLRIPSAKGKWKVFSTCGSHLTVVALFYGSGLAVFFTPPSSHSKRKDTAASMMYTVVTPMFNPFIYSLRNKDMKGVVKKWVC
ncbi:olfactory receptor 1F1-like [Ornithorhynchus anatinus]|uniref:olfactory receptor 1F1-like n=1 Tax=Ornithorhynchus anatinus TaxID=9258 RepID=UPI0010A86171|nr:olfactory receptor 1F1-like [Ornithorhynchus anatinus]